MLTPRSNLPSGGLVTGTLLAHIWGWVQGERAGKGTWRVAGLAIRSRDGMGCCAAESARK